MSSRIQVNTNLPTRLNSIIVLIALIAFSPISLLVLIAGIRGKDITYITLSLSLFIFTFGFVLYFPEFIKITEFSDDGIKIYKKFFKYVGKATYYSYNDFEKIYLNFYKGVELCLVKKRTDLKMPEEYISFTYSNINFEKIILFLKDKLNPDCYHPSFFIFYNKIDNPSRSFYDKIPKKEIISWLIFIFIIYMLITVIKEYLIR